MSALITIVGFFALIYLARKIVRFAIKMAFGLMLLMMGQNAFFTFLSFIPFFD